MRDKETLSDKGREVFVRHLQKRKNILITTYDEKDVKEFINWCLKHRRILPNFDFNKNCEKDFMIISTKEFKEKLGDKLVENNSK